MIDLPFRLCFYKIFTTTTVRSSACAFSPAKAETASVIWATKVEADSVSLLLITSSNRSIENSSPASSSCSVTPSVKSVRISP